MLLENSFLGHPIRFVTNFIKLRTNSMSLNEETFCTFRNTEILLEAGMRLLRFVLSHIPPKMHLIFEGRYEWTFFYIT